LRIQAETSLRLWWGVQAERCRRYLFSIKDEQVPPIVVKTCSAWPTEYCNWPSEADPGDALQHCIGACNANQHPGPCCFSSVARQLVNLIDVGKTDDDSKNDLKNNDVGFAVKGDCTEGCLQALKDGKLWCESTLGQVKCAPPP
jgi:hypothetical protein